MDLTIVIPLFNEEINIDSVIPNVIKFAEINNINVIFVNDGSKDKTKELLSKYLNNNNIYLINHKLNKGYGGAIKSGILKTESKYVVTIDADGQHILEDILRLYDTILQNDADMIIGCRCSNKSENFYRVIGKTLIRKFAQLLMVLPVKDLNSGMKLYNVEIARKYINLLPDGMPFSDTIAISFIYNRNLVIEIPISINNRIAGISTINTKTAFDTITAILNIVVLYNPTRIFLPLSLSLLFIGLFWGIPLVYMGKGVSVGASLIIILAYLTFLFGLIAEQLSKIRIIK